MDLPTLPLLWMAKGIKSEINNSIYNGMSSSDLSFMPNVSLM